MESSTRATTLGASALALLALALVFTVSAPESGAQAGNSCSPPKRLAPTGNGPQRYTLILRVNQLVNAEDYADPEVGLRERLRPRDIFLVNTRFKKMSQSERLEIVQLLKASFPCNRIFALNGLGSEPNSPGFSRALADTPQVSALLLDWESGDWQQSENQSSGVPPWSHSFQPNRNRAWKRLRRVARASARAVKPRGRRVGLVPAFYPAWDYGLMARMIDRRNRALEKGHGFQIVQTQGACMFGRSDFRDLTGFLLRQYHPKYRLKTIRVRGKKRKIKVKVKPRAQVRNLGLEISFSNTPDPSDPRPVANVHPSKAANCTHYGLKRGGGAFLYWAHPGSMLSLFRNTTVCRLRPPPEGRKAC